MIERTYIIRGVAPLIVHNAQLSDPLNKWTRLVAEISKKKKKTEDDLQELSRREWFGSLYMSDDESHPVIPETNLERMMRDGAAKQKRGKDVQSSMIVLEPAPILFKGPKKADDMWAAGTFFTRDSCKVGQQRVIRTRPCWREWSVKFVVNFDESVLDARDLDAFLVTAGKQIGLGDWRPKHGRFVMEEAS